MTQEVIKESEQVKITLLRKDNENSQVIKEFSDEKLFENELKFIEQISRAIKAEVEGNKLIFPFLTPLGSKLTKPMPEKEALRLMNQSIDILEELKNKGLVHRDLKPGNLYLDNDQKLYISDFETVLAKEEQKERTCGTPGFMAPEQYKCPNVDWLADQYSLGAVFFNILTGTKPFHSGSKEELFEAQSRQSPDPSMINSKLKKPFLDLVMTMMNKDKEKRFQSIEEIHHALDKCSQSLVKTKVLEDSVIKIAPKKKTESKKKFSSLILSGAIILILLIYLFKFL